MDSKQLTQGLHQAFFAENHRIVFWYDPEQNFADALNELDLPDVQVLNMQGKSTFGTKLQLELEDTQGKYQCHQPKLQPCPRQAPRSSQPPWPSGDDQASAAQSGGLAG
ncbi:hypothetical protein ACV4WU_32430, partial [Pseudomonas aeruginosa]